MWSCECQHMEFRNTVQDYLTDMLLARTPELVIIGEMVSEPNTISEDAKTKMEGPRLTAG